MTGLGQTLSCRFMNDDKQLSVDSSMLRYVDKFDRWCIRKVKNRDGNTCGANKGACDHCLTRLDQQAKELGLCDPTLPLNYPTS